MDPIKRRAGKFFSLILFLSMPLRISAYAPYPFERQEIHELWLRGNLKDPFFDYSPLPEDVLRTSLKENSDTIGNRILKRYLYIYKNKVKVLNFNLLSSFEFDTVWDIALFPRASIRFSGVNLLWEPVERTGNDSLYPRFKKGAMMRLDFDRAFISFEKKGLYTLLGRERVSWGGDPLTPMIFSGYSPAFDMFFLSYRKKIRHIGLFHAQYGATQLDDFRDGDRIIKRYLVFHRLDFSPGRTLRLGYSEIVLFGGVDRTFDFYYLNPWIIYYPYQWNRGKVSSDNYIWALDGRLTLNKNSLYGALLVDDIQLIPTGEPPDLALSVVFESADPLFTEGTYFRASYQATTRWTFTHSDLWERFYYLGFPLSHPLVPDFDQLRLFFSLHLSPKSDLLSQLEVTREGETTLFTPWPQGGFPNNNFLSGTVQTTLSFKIGFQSFKSFHSGGTLGFNFWLGGNTVKNYQHKKGRKKNFPSLNALLTIQF